jgi:adenylate kinase family enzyme
MRLLITGASGAGTSTLGRELAASIGGVHLESDDYFWLPTSPPYQTRRDGVERLCMLMSDLRAYNAPVLAGSIVDWGSDVEDFFDLIVFLYVETDVRLERLRKREVERFGHVDPELLKWASQYDTVSRKERSLAMHKVWLAQRKCRVLKLLGDLTVEERVSRVLQNA